MKIITLTKESLKNIINQVINESMYARRRGKSIERYLEDALEAIDPLDYEDEFDDVDDMDFEDDEEYYDGDFEDDEEYDVFDDSDDEFSIG